MTSIRRFRACDLFNLSLINLDPKTETFSIAYYQYYLSNWPTLFNCSTQFNTSSLTAYCMNKIENEYENKNYKSHISALSVSPNFRRLKIGELLMRQLEEISEKIYNTYFIDLYVRASNKSAIKMYENLGYIVYRRIIGYYSASPVPAVNTNQIGVGTTFNSAITQQYNTAEDGLDMRKSLKRDQQKLAMIPLPHPVYPSEVD